jgi:GNAT superfamily N-acetyltransferase
VSFLGVALDPSALPADWHARPPEAVDVTALARLREATRRGPGDAPAPTTATDASTVEAVVVGPASWTRRQLMVTDPAGAAVAWAVLHDRAAGRTEVEVMVLPATQHADRIAGALFTWADAAGRVVASLRHVPRTQLDSGTRADDERQRRWLAAAGYRCVRTWLQMSRPVEPGEAAPGALPAARAGVTVRRVRAHENGLPVAEDLHLVHQLLEESFADHFNSYREGFAEFVVRLQEDPWHRWDHWWIALVEVDQLQQPGGALISSVLPPDAAGRFGSYVDYIGVHRRARGRGVAKALLHTVIADAARRERNRVGLEVDADSSTGADGLYLSLGWQTCYRTESWHRYLATER